MLGSTIDIAVPDNGGANALQVPLAAVFDIGGGPGIWIVDDKTSSVSFKRVEVAAIGVETATVSNGIKPGERFVSLGAHLLHEGGLVVKSPAGDVTILKPPTVTADKLDTPYDLIVLSCKAYDLQAAINGLTPAVGPSTRILPLLNGILHMDILSSRFGAEHILGGLCRIASSLNADGEIVHTGDLESLMFGARDTANEAFALEVEATFAGTGIAFTRSDQIVQEMWEKWVFIATCAGLTTLMRAPIGDIVEAGGTDIAHLMLAECSQLANSCGFPPRATSLETFRKIFTTPNSPITASLFRDLESGGRIEADHLIGDLLDRAVPTERPVVILRVAYTHMKAYEARRRREAWNTV